MLYRCLSCEASYDDMLEDGSTYYHSCHISTKDRRDENVDTKGKVKKEGKGRKKIGV